MALCVASAKNYKTDANPCSRARGQITGFIFWGQKKGESLSPPPKNNLDYFLNTALKADIALSNLATSANSSPLAFAFLQRVFMVSKTPLSL